MPMLKDKLNVWNNDLEKLNEKNFKIQSLIIIERTLNQLDEDPRFALTNILKFISGWKVMLKSKISLTEFLWLNWTP